MKGILYLPLPKWLVLAWREVFPPGMSDCFARGWRLFWALLVVAIVLAMAILMSVKPADATEPSVLRAVAQVLTVDLKNEAGLCLDLVLGDKVSHEGDVTSFRVEGHSSGRFDISTQWERPALVVLMPPQGFYRQSLENVSDPVSKIWVSQILYKDHAVSAVEAAKLFASRVFLRTTGEIEPGGDGTRQWSTVPVYPAQRWIIVGSPILVGNRASITLVSHDKLARVKLSLVVVRRDRGYRLEICEVDARRRESNPKEVV